MSYIDHTGQPVPPQPHPYPYPQSGQQMYAPAPNYAKPVFPARRNRYWVHVVPAITLLGVIIVPFVYASRAYQEGASTGNIDGAGFGAIFAWLFGTIFFGIIGSFVTFLAYLLVLPPRSRGMRITLIVFTSIAGFMSLLILLALPTIGAWIFV